MVIETALSIAQQLLALNPFILLGLVIVLAFVAFKLFAFVFKLLLTGAAFGAFPFIANFLGIPVPITMQSILWSAITGIVIYFAYVGMRFGFKIVNLAYYPFRKTFAKKSEKKKMRKDILKDLEKKKLSQ